MLLNRISKPAAVDSPDTDASMHRCLPARYRNLRLHPLDMLCLGYISTIVLLIVIFQANLAGWYRHVILHTAAAVIILELVRAAREYDLPLLGIIRTAYPILGFGFAWLELDRLFTLIFPFYGTDIIIAWDKALFGVHPTLWAERIFTLPVTELMNFFYAVYFLFLPAGTLLIYRRKGQTAALNFLFIVFSCYFSVFLFSLLFPVEGAWTSLAHLHTVEPDGGLFLTLNRWIQSNGSVKGGAFPSVHVTGAVAIGIASLSYQKRYGIIVLFLSAGVAVSTVYCRYHHGLDAAAGILWALAVSAAAHALLKSRDKYGTSP